MHAKLVWIVGVAGLVAAASVGTAHLVSSHAAASPAAAALPQYGAVPVFSLTDQQGRLTTHEEFEGRVWVADFIFTTCPGQCALMSDQMCGLQRTFAKEEGLRFVSFSVDPARDTPPVLSAYAQRYGADPRWVLLTGSRDTLRALCRDAFHLAVDETPAGSREPIIHSLRLVLVDHRGAIRGYYDATDPGAMARLRRDLARLLREAA